jgi:hypothetical protein
MTDQPDQQEKTEDRSLQLHVAPDLEYVYRDIFNVFVGAGEVVIEFGNIHRAMPSHATINNRIVVSIGNAYTLIQTIQNALQQAQINLQRQLQEKGKS